MAEYIYDIMHIILEKFIKKSIMEKATSMAMLAKVDVMEKDNLVHAKNVDIGFATKKIISEMQTKKKASNRQVFEFQNEYLIFLQSLVAKLLERCPLQYPVVRYFVCLDPRYMVAKPEQAIRKMTQFLEKLMNLKQISVDDCDAIIRQYKTFIAESCSKLVIFVTEHVVEVADKLSTTAVVFFRSERILQCKCLYGA